ncbi:MAG: hypothetical protein MUE85_09025 [Microscillaceae bacterium]|jgi:hypothetical protein|nr:hypothetical protein [Microscillaceae bacterium]
MKHKYQVIKLLIISYLAISWQVSAQDKSRYGSLELFQKYWLGSFDNSRQIQAEKLSGRQIHPYARQINRVMNKKIKNIPADFQGVFIWSENHYLNPEQSDTTAKFTLYKIEAIDNQSVRLYFIDLPLDWHSRDFGYLEPDSQLDFKDLKVLPNLRNGLVYMLKEGQFFYTKTIFNLSAELRLTLEEYVSKNLRSVLELTEKNGQRLTSYDTPILYDRVKKFKR